MNGIDGLRYISSDSNSDGSMSITVTFNQGTDPDIAQVQVQNKLQLATPLLPQEVQQQGIRVTKAVRNFLMVVGVVSADGSMNQSDQIGRASCRERVCQNVWTSGVTVYLKKK